MTELEKLLQDIEKLRANLIRLINEKDEDLLDAEVLKASQELNAHITKYNEYFFNK